MNVERQKHAACVLQDKKKYMSLEVKMQQALWYNQLIVTIPNSTDGQSLVRQRKIVVTMLLFLFGFFL